MWVSALLSIGVALGPAAMPGYSPRQEQRQTALEQRVLSLTDARSTAEISRVLAERPHIAGSEEQRANQEYCLKRMGQWGLETETAEYEVYLPYTNEVRLERITPHPKAFDLIEPPLPEDPGTVHTDRVLPQNGYSASGEATGEIVYANYGLPEDIQTLAELKVDLEGKIAVVRYGRAYRGNKVDNVAQAGAAGCILYSDPTDDGFVKGDVYPKGPMRPERGLQRGSIKLNLGDPTTPGWASVPGAKRVQPQDAKETAKIPAIPVGYATAAELLSLLEGPETPDGWQGGLSFRYHVGPGPVSARLKVKTDGQYRRIRNVFGRIAGSDFPDEWVIVGAHADAWCCGAMDNVSGDASVLEAARICAALAEQGARPRRTLIFALWDAEEWGIIGSTEWVEQMRDALDQRAVVYVNQDSVVSGPDFGVSGSPSLHGVIRDIVRLAPSPDEPERSVFDVWSGKNENDPEIGIPGGGSDHAPFLLGVGIPVAGHGFGGRQGIYHSIYDTTRWMETFGDPGYRRHAASAQIAALLMLRLANADIVPYDHAGFGDALCRMVADLQKKATEAAEATDSKGGEVRARLELDGLVAAVNAFRRAGEGLSKRLNVLQSASIATAEAAAINAELRQVERCLTRPEGVCGSALYRNVVFGLDRGNGYGRYDFPAVAEALGEGDVSRAQGEVIDVTERIRTATAYMETAAGMLSRLTESAPAVAPAATESQLGR